jgi:hypothetical protein
MEPARRAASKARDGTYGGAAFVGLDEGGLVGV